MQARGKIIGCLLGAMVFGPIGALIGLYIGHRSDKRRRRGELDARLSGRKEAVAAAVTALGAKLAKADGRISQAEVRAFRKTFRVPERDLARIAELWREAARTPAGYEPFARHLAQIFAGRGEMLLAIFAGLQEVVAADGRLDPRERWALEDVARIFGLGPGWEMLRAPAQLNLAGAEMSADAVSAAYSEIFDDGAADDDRQVFGADGSSRSGLAGLLAHPDARPILVACAFVTGLLAVRLSGVAQGLFPLSEAALAPAGGALAALAAWALLGQRGRLPRAARKAAAAAGVAASEVAALAAETGAKIGRILEAAAQLEAPVRERVGAICEHARGIVDELLKNPADVARSRPFLLHYLDATGEVVQRFADLRGRPGAEAQFGEVMAKMEPLLADIEALFRRRYESGLKEDARELDVSIDSLQRMIRSEARA